MATVVFSDLSGSTSLRERLPARVKRLDIERRRRKRDLQRSF